MKRSLIMFGSVMVLGLLAAPALAAKCPPDSVKVGPVCVDKYEASVWQIYAADLREQAQKGELTLADLARLPSSVAHQEGANRDNYECTDDGNGLLCEFTVALSIAGVMPSRFISWFQAQQACAGAGKRLLTNAEWQMAAARTPDPGDSPGPNDCNTNSSGPALTGSRTGCVSRWGVFDMVGNLSERVEDWVPQSASCVDELFSGTGDANCFAGAETAYGPAALLRGGSFLDGAQAGVFTVSGQARLGVEPGDLNGFRCAR